MQLLTYKYRLKDRRARRLLEHYTEVVNYVWNYCWDTQKKAQKIYKQGSKIKWPSHFDLQHLTSNTSKELGIHAQTIQEVCRQFTVSRDTRKKCPRKRKDEGSKKALGWVPFQVQSRQLEGNSIKYLGKVIRFFGAKRRPLPDVVKGGCFAQDSQGKWYVCLQVEVNSLPLGTGEVGIDLGLKDLVVTSDGTKVENPKVYKQLEEKLGKAQRAQKRKRVKAINAKIKNTRKDFLHKVSNKLASANRLIVVGNVSVTKGHFAKSAYDAGWSTLREMLRYKASRHGASYAVVNEAFTTQTCLACGNGATEARPKGIAGLGIREWVCSVCGASHDRDVNSAQNILRLGRSAAPPGEGSRKKHRVLEYQLTG